MDDVEIMARGMRSEGEASDPLEQWEIVLAQAALAALESSGRVVVPKETIFERLRDAVEVLGMPWTNVVPPSEDVDLFAMRMAWFAMIEEASNAGK